MKKSKTSILVECALMIALSTVLGMITIFALPQGGSITLCSMMPIMLVSFRHGIKWGVFTGFVHGLIQMILGIENVMYCTTIWSMIGCVLLDYFIAFTALGLAAMFTGGNPAPSTGKVVAGCAVAGLIRFACSFLSGILIWGGYAPEDMPVWLYSLVYNGSYMIPEIIITCIATALVVKLLTRKKAA